MDKIVDAKMIEKEIERMNSFFNPSSDCRKNVNENRVAKRTFGKGNLMRLCALDITAGFANHLNETKGEHPTGTEIKQFLYYASDLFMSSLTDSTKKSFMEYLNSKESDEEFDDLSHIRGYLLNEFDENGNERNPSPEEETKKEQNGKDKILN